MFDEELFRGNIQIISNWKHVMHIPESLAGVDFDKHILTGDE